MAGLNPQTQDTTCTPLLELIDNCTQCLTLTQDFVANTLPSPNINPADQASGQQNEKEENEIDLNALENFLALRADIFALAESSLNQVCNQPKAENDDPNHRELRSRAINILEEMAEIEGNLTAFFSERLSKIKSNLTQLKKSKPIFKRYANLGRPTQPNCISRHE